MSAMTNSLVTRNSAIASNGVMTRNRAVPRNGAVVRAGTVTGNVAMTKNVSVTKAELAKIVGEIGWYEDQARKTVMLALQYKFEIGRRLARAKLLLPHGQFLSWARQEFGWSPRHVQRHLMLAENASSIPNLPPGASLRMALAAIRKMRTDPEKSAAEATASVPTQRIHIVGEIEEGTIDRDLLLSRISQLAEELGAQKTRWRIR
jgi:hypothetical protein